ncbi:EAL domain-containing protein [Zoogloea sp.]|uniref:EAL domain-containing protein n=1 Tax=Zoogloea sp. TaxID=49181 RepID=UPI002632B9A3|nr:EAL domain-containing protein [Zoogloea sp.]MDD3352827.1 EAL domain-containing protein [Zoogloea sp.]
MKSLWRGLQALLFKSLRRQLIVGVALVHASMMGIFVFDLTYRQREMLLHRQVEENIYLSRGLAISSANALGAMDLAGLQEIIASQHRLSYVRFAMILDRDGRVVAHTESKRIGSYVLDLPDEPARMEEVQLVSRQLELVDSVAPVVMADRLIGWARIGTQHQDTQQELDAITREGLLYTLAAILIGTLLAWAMADRLTRRMRTLVGVMEQVRQGKEDERVAIIGQDELATLGTDFNSMLDALAAQRGALATSEADLGQQKRFLRALIQSIPDLVWLKNTQGVYLLCNPRFEQFFGQPEADIIGKTDHDFVAVGIADAFRANDRIALESGVPHANQEEVTFASDGHKEWLLTIKSPMYDSEGRIIGVIGIGRDMSLLRQAEQVMQASLDQLNEAQRIAKLGSWFLDLDSRQLECSEETFRILEMEPAGRKGFSYDELLEIVHPDDRATLRALYEKTFSGDTDYDVTHRLVMPDGRIKHVHALGEIQLNEHGQAQLIHGTVQDITERIQSEAEIHRLANYDALTGLPNRRLLTDRLAQALATRRRLQRKETLILFNIDRFKNINDARGIAIGDTLLMAVALRLQGLTREGDTLARLSADEFALYISNQALHPSPDGRQALAVAEKIHNALRTPFIIAGDEISITASLGITLFPEHNEDTPEGVLLCADTALHRAKAAGGNRSAFFETAMGEAVQQRFAIEAALHRGIPAGELRLFLQPQVDEEGHPVGAEVLVRWQHPQRGLLPPGTFIPVAEESDLIVELGTWVLEAACQLMAREDMAGNPLRLSVNLSPRHFRQSGFVPWVRQVLTATGADPTRLTLEVTEGLVVDNVGEVVSKMSELAILGVHFSIDDFGTGYSSLAYLKRLPIHELKIDKTFVQDAPTDPDDAALVETILSIARHMHLKVVAEGVETREQADFLNTRGNVIHQGYLFGKPEPAEVWLERWRKAEERF